MNQIKQFFKNIGLLKWSEMSIGRKILAFISSALLIYGVYLVIFGSDPLLKKITDYFVTLVISINAFVILDDWLDYQKHNIQNA